MTRFFVSPTELWGRSIQKALSYGERSLPTLFLRDISGNLVFNRCLAFNKEDRLKVRRALSETSSVERIVKQAECVKEGSVPILGFGATEVGNPPLWHREPISGKVSPTKHWDEIEFLDLDIVGDHKIIWELNRHQYLLAVAQAWVLTEDKRWSELLASHVIDWIEKNPPAIGVNWSSSLEVAYRAISWCWILRLAGESEEIQSIMPLLTASIYAHARHIRRYLSTWFSPNTHLTGEALGLLYIDTFFSAKDMKFDFGSKACSILRDQLAIQVYADGVYFEHSTHYHRYTAEIYLHFLILKEWRAEQVNPAFDKRIRDTFYVLSHLNRSDGTMALVGDDDGGSLLPLDEFEPHELSGLLTAAGFFWNDASLALHGRNEREMAVWLFAGKRELTSAESLFEEETGRLFPVGGLLVARDSWSKGSGHVTLDAGRHGSLSSGHSHSDALSLELFAGGGQLLVDSGTFSYVGERRNEFRGARSHNVVEIDGAGSSEPAVVPFRWLSTNDAKVKGFYFVDGVTMFEGEVAGVGGDGRNVHVRSLLHPCPGLWIIDDKVISQVECEMRVNWHFSPSVSPFQSLSSSEPDSAEINVLRDGRKVATCLILSTHAGEVNYERCSVSSRMGRLEDAVRCSWISRLNGDASVVLIVLDWTVLNDHPIHVYRGMLDTPSYSYTNQYPHVSSGTTSIRWLPNVDDGIGLVTERLLVDQATPNQDLRVVKALPGLSVIQREVTK